MLTVYIILRWAHILGAAMLVGGTIFWRCAVIPAGSELAEDLQPAVSTALRRRWAQLVMIASGLLLVSGLINFMNIVIGYELNRDEVLGRLYHPLFGIKFLLSLAVFMLAALLSGRSPAAEKMRQNERFWVSVNVVLVVAVVCLGGLLRAADREPKAPGGAALQYRGGMLNADASI